MPGRNSALVADRILPGAISAIAVLCMLALGGCSSYSPPSPAEQATLAKTELHFSIDQCQPIEPGLFKCPATDKPICNPDYNGQLECVRIGPKGSVFVQRGIAD